VVPSRPIPSRHPVAVASCHSTLGGIQIVGQCWTLEAGSHATTTIKILYLTNVLLVGILLLVGFQWQTADVEKILSSATKEKIL